MCITKLLEIQELKGRESALLLGISAAYLSDIKKGKSKGKGYKLWSAIRDKLPEWEAYLLGVTDTPPEPRPLIRMKSGKKTISVIPAPDDHPAVKKRQIGAGTGQSQDTEEARGKARPSANHFAQAVEDVKELFKLDEPAIQSLILGRFEDITHTGQLLKEFTEVKRRLANIEQLLKSALEKHSPPDGQPERRKAWIAIGEAIRQ